MIPKKNRLNKEKDIEYVLKKGQIKFSPILNIKYLPAETKVSRFCIIISKKISLKAVVRNRSKRQISASLQDLIENIKKPVDVVILTKPAITITEQKDIQDTLDKTLRKAQII